MKNRNFQNAFSLMEMMVVLLIVAIVAAATAPMVTKKMARSVSSNDSPWVFTGLNNSIAYNMGGADASAIIGATNYSYSDNQPKYPRLVLAANGADRPALVFAKSNGAFGGQINMDPDNKIVTMNDQTVGKNSVAFGFGQHITNTPTGSVLIGQGVIAQSDDTVAIGKAAASSALGTVAIGRQAVTTGSSSVAIGNQARALYSNSVAIGNQARAFAENQIVLGTANDTVYIPGKLVVAGNVGFCDMVYLTPGNKDHRSQWVYLGTEDYKGGDDNFWRTSKPDFIYSDVRIYSDRRLKNVGEKYTAGLEELKKLDFYHYTFKADKDNTPLVGVIAQDLQKVFPDAVTKDESGYLRIRIEDMFYAVINAVKELDTKVSQLVADVTGISSKVDEQQKVIEAQQQKIDELEKANADFEKRLAKLEKKNKKFEE